jgi:hypothetical protein
MDTSGRPAEQFALRFGLGAIHTDVVYHHAAFSVTGHFVDLDRPTQSLSKARR